MVNQKFNNDKNKRNRKKNPNNPLFCIHSCIHIIWYFVQYKCMFSMHVPEVKD